MTQYNYFQLKPGKIYKCSIDDKNFEGKFKYKLQNHYLVYRKIGQRKWVMVCNSRWYSDSVIYVEDKPGRKIKAAPKPAPKFKFTGHEEFPYGYICSECAKSKGLTWEKGACATFHTNTCKYCNTEQSVCAVSDWLLPGEKKVPLIRWD